MSGSDPYLDAWRARARAERRDRLLLLVAELADERARVARLLSEFEHASTRSVKVEP